MVPHDPAPADEHELVTTTKTGDERAFAFIQDGHEPPLPQIPAFQRFQRDLAERCEEAPQVMRLAEFVGHTASDP